MKDHISRGCLRTLLIIIIGSLLTLIIIGFIFSWCMNGAGNTIDYRVKVPNRLVKRLSQIATVFPASLPTVHRFKK